MEDILSLELETRLRGYLNLIIKWNSSDLVSIRPYPQRTGLVFAMNSHSFLVHFSASEGNFTFAGRCQSGVCDVDEKQGKIR